jgi:hypothetical protein
MTDWKLVSFSRFGHGIHVFWIPCSDNCIAGIRILCKLSEDKRYLIYDMIRIFGGPVSPCLSIDIIEISMLCSKLWIISDLINKLFFGYLWEFSFFDLILIGIIWIVIPDMDVIFDEKLDILIST